MRETRAAIDGGIAGTAAGGDAPEWSGGMEERHTHPVEA
jgi:hypothetical protein